MHASQDIGLSFRSNFSGDRQECMCKHKTDKQQLSRNTSRLHGVIAPLNGAATTAKSSIPSLIGTEYHPFTEKMTLLWENFWYDIGMNCAIVPKRLRRSINVFNAQLIEALTMQQSAAFSPHWNINEKNPEQRRNVFLANCNDNTFETGQYLQTPPLLENCDFPEGCEEPHSTPSEKPLGQKQAILDLATISKEHILPKLEKGHVDATKLLTNLSKVLTYFSAIESEIKLTTDVVDFDDAFRQYITKAHITKAQGKNSSQRPSTGGNGTQLVTSESLPIENDYERYRMAFRDFLPFSSLTPAQQRLLFGKRLDRHHNVDAPDARSMVEQYATSAIFEDTEFRYTEEEQLFILREYANQLISVLRIMLQHVARLTSPNLSESAYDLVVDNIVSEHLLNLYTATSRDAQLNSLHSGKQVPVVDSTAERLQKPEKFQQLHEATPLLEESWRWVTSSSSETVVHPIAERIQQIPKRILNDRGQNGLKSSQQKKESLLAAAKQTGPHKYDIKSYHKVQEENSEPKLEDVASQEVLPSSNRDLETQIKRIYFFLPLYISIARGIFRHVRKFRLHFPTSNLQVHGTQASNLVGGLPSHTEPDRSREARHQEVEIKEILVDNSDKQPFSTIYAMRKIEWWSCMETILAKRSMKLQSLEESRVILVLLILDLLSSARVSNALNYYAEWALRKVLSDGNLIHLTELASTLPSWIESIQLTELPIYLLSNALVPKNTNEVPSDDFTPRVPPQSDIDKALSMKQDLMDVMQTEDYSKHEGLPKNIDYATVSDEEIVSLSSEHSPSLLPPVLRGPETQGDSSEQYYISESSSFSDVNKGVLDFSPITSTSHLQNFRTVEPDQKPTTNLEKIFQIHYTHQPLSEKGRLVEIQARTKTNCKPKINAFIPPNIVHIDNSSSEYSDIVESKNPRSFQTSNLTRTHVGFSNNKSPLNSSHSEKRNSNIEKNSSSSCRCSSSAETGFPPCIGNRECFEMASGNEYLGSGKNLEKHNEKLCTCQHSLVPYIIGAIEEGLLSKVIKSDKDIKKLSHKIINDIEKRLAMEQLIVDFRNDTSWDKSSSHLNNHANLYLHQPYDSDFRNLECCHAMTEHCMYPCQAKGRQYFVSKLLKSHMPEGFCPDKYKQHRIEDGKDGATEKEIHGSGLTPKCSCNLEYLRDSPERAFTNGETSKTRFRNTRQPKSFVPPLSNMAVAGHGSWMTGQFTAGD